MKKLIILFILVFLTTSNFSLEKFPENIAAKKKGKVTMTTSFEAFSPNKDKRRDEQLFTIVATPTNSISKWTLSVFRIGGSHELIYSQSGEKKMPKTISWNGMYSEGAKKGQIASEGVYESKLNISWTFNYSSELIGNQFTLDLTPPSISLATDEKKSFSPNGDNIQDTIHISQTKPSKETQWTASIKNSLNSVVRTNKWLGDPSDFEWNGKDDKGSILPDGSYTYELQCEDKAGNNSVWTISGIQIDTSDANISLATKTQAFSPDGNGKIDQMDFSITSNRDIIPISYILEIIDLENKKVIQTLSGKNPFSEGLTWKGDGQKGQAPEGKYMAKISLISDSGLNSHTSSNEFLLLLSVPKPLVKLSTKIFSPDGDGKLDQVIISQETKPRLGQTNYKGIIRTSKGKIISSFDWNDSIPTSIAWDGKGSDNKIVPDGQYEYIIEVKDLAQNESKSDIQSFIIDTKLPNILVKAQFSAFSPNGDAINETEKFSFTNTYPTGISDYDFYITALNSSEKIFEKSGTLKLPESINWDGKSLSKNVPDGEYQIHLVVSYAKGNVIEVHDPRIFVDTSFPQIEGRILTSIFSPEGDGEKDFGLIEQVNASQEKMWTGSIMDDAKKIVRSFTWTGIPENITWDGNDDQNLPAKDGKYSYQISSKDEAGNQTKKIIGSLIIDRTKTSFNLDSLVPGFNPKSVRLDLQNLVIKPKLSLNSGIENFSIEIVDEKSTAFYSANGKNQLALEYRWNGKKGTGIVPDGKYIVRVKIVYAKGNKLDFQSSPIMVDTSPPLVNFEPGPLPFSPDDDGTNDTVDLGFTATDASGILNWRLDFYDPFGNLFDSKTGTQVPEKGLSWNGKGKNGELVQAAIDYSCKLTVNDIYDNSLSIERSIPTDVFVFKDGKDLRIRLPGIEFASGSDELFGSDSEKAEKNRKTIASLVEILNRYANYSIIIEGHANSAKTKSGKIPNALEQKGELLPLSEKRALAVKQALIDAGLKADRLFSRGMGGSKPLVDFSNAKNIWKNRRVEFILEKK